MIISSASVAIGGLFVLRAGGDVVLARMAQTLLFYEEKDKDDNVVKLSDANKLIRCSTAKAVWLTGRLRCNTFNEK